MSERVQAAKEARQWVIDTAIADAFEGLALPQSVSEDRDGAIEIRYRNGMIFRGWWINESDAPKYAGKWQKLEPRYWA